MMHKGHTGFYSIGRQAIWYDFSLLEKWWVTLPSSWRSLQRGKELDKLVIVSSRAVLTLPEEYLK